MVSWLFVDMMQLYLEFLLSTVNPVYIPALAFTIYNSYFAQVTCLDYQYSNYLKE